MPSLNWSSAYRSAEELQKDLPGLKFAGPGWYLDGSNWLLVENRGEGLWAYHYYGDPRPSMREILELPEHK